MGKIILLNTPIGNIDDMTLRVRASLKEGEIFAVEDTRSFKELLNHLEISLEGKKIYSLHDHTKESSLEFFINIAKENTLYVASEAGSPIISDPAYPLMVMAYENDIEVDSYSGVSSPLLALELSGLPPIPFHFHGFLPRESSKKSKIFKDVPYGTNIFFESPHRIIDTIDELCKFEKDLDICIVRELSKKFQQVLKFRSQEWGKVKDKLTIKGEFVLLFYRATKEDLITEDLKNLVQDVLDEGVTTKKLSRIFANVLNKSPKEIYALLSK